MNVTKIINDYTKQFDWRIAENANMAYSFPNMLLNLSGVMLAKYALENMYCEPMKAGEMHNKGQLHIHDLGGSIAPYCAGHSLLNLLNIGFNGLDTHVSSNPAKHLRSAMSHIINFVGSMSNEFMGAQAFSDVDVYLSAFILKDMIYNSNKFGQESSWLITKSDLNQSLQELFFNLNFTTRWGGQSPFSNFSLALGVPEDLQGLSTGIEVTELVGDVMRLINDKLQLKISIPPIGQMVTYEDIKSLVYIFDKEFFDVFNKGDASGKPFSFPIITVNLNEDFFKLPKYLYDTIISSVAKYGTCYFQNFINGEIAEKKMKQSDTRSMCCRLQLDLKELQAHTGGLFGNGDSTGSLSVVTINLPELGYIAKGNLILLKSNIKEWMNCAREALLKKREVILEMYDRGLFPYTKTYLPNRFSTYFLTFGYVGMHECLLNYGIEGGISSEKGLSLAIDLLKYMSRVVKSFQVKDKVLYNLEGVPAEGASFRLARLSRKRIPDLITAGTKSRPYFTNSCHLPVSEQDNIVKIIKHQEPLQRLHSGGTILHLYIGEELGNQDIETIIKMVSQTKIPYFTISPVFSICPIHGYVAGKHEYCPLPHSSADLEKYGVTIKSKS